MDEISASIMQHLDTIEAIQRAMQGQLTTMQSGMPTRHHRLITKRELRAWMALLVALLGASVTVLLTYG